MKHENIDCDEHCQRPGSVYLLLIVLSQGEPLPALLCTRIIYLSHQQQAALYSNIGSCLVLGWELVELSTTDCKAAIFTRFKPSSFLFQIYLFLPSVSE